MGGPLPVRGAEAAEDVQKLGAAAARLGGEDDEDQHVVTVEGELVRVQVQIADLRGAVR